MEIKEVKHNLKPIYNKNSKILILGTMPSPKSREKSFYYSHPQNRFWKVLYKLFDENISNENSKRIEFLYKNNIALWDVLYSCKIEGASDSSIKEPIPNDINIILKEANIKAIFTTGKKAYELYQKYCFPKTKINAISLPSTSPANFKYSLDKLVEEYKIIKNFL